jgi:hypothetical protein
MTKFFCTVILPELGDCHQANRYFQGLDLNEAEKYPHANVEGFYPVRDHE